MIHSDYAHDTLYANDPRTCMQLTLLNIFVQITVTLEKQSKADMKIWSWKLVGFQGGSVVKNPPAKAEEQDSIPGLGRPHMLGSS